MRLAHEAVVYKVVHAPSVLVRDQPAGKIIATRKVGDLVRTNARSLGPTHSNWVRLDEPVSAHAPNHAKGWMLIDGTALGLGTLLTPVQSPERILLKRYRVAAQPSLDVIDKPNGQAVIGKRAHGRVVRIDMELDGFVRLQADFFRPGNREPCDGWLSLGNGGKLLTAWQLDVDVTAVAEQVKPEPTFRMWVVVKEGVVVRERPWGRMVARKGHGALLRCDALKDGWVRLEEDFVDQIDADMASRVTVSSLGFALDSDCEDEMQLVEGWVLVDGRDVGLQQQLVAYGGEGEAPPTPRLSKEEERAIEKRNLARREVARAMGGGYTGPIANSLNGCVPPEVVSKLQAAGVNSLADLIQTLSHGDAHTELRRLGVVKLGQRQKLTSVVQPYWLALSAKERGNDLYRQSRFEEAIFAYTEAIENMACHGSDIAINCFSNRAACHQQLRDNAAALRDVICVLDHDPLNAKALARRQVNEQALGDI